MSKVLGNWTPGISVPLQSRLLWAAHGEGSDLTIVDDTLYFQSFDGNYVPLKLFQGSDLHPRMIIDGDEAICRGPGGGTAPNTKILRGRGSPDGVVAAGVESIYQREDGGAGTSLYVKESGIDHFGWVAK